MKDKLPVTGRGGAESDLQLVLLRLHERVLNGHLGAFDELASVLLPILRSTVRQMTRELDTEVVDDAAEHALLVYVGNPTAYEPDRSSLVHWLAVIAKNKVRDLQRERERWRRLVGGAGDWIEPAAPPPTLYDESPEGTSIPVLRGLALSVAHDPREHAFIVAKLAGERRSAPLADILGVGNYPVPVQRRIVKRIWDCLRARMLRLEIPPGGGGRRVNNGT